MPECSFHMGFKKVSIYIGLTSTKREEGGGEGLKLNSIEIESPP